MSRFHRPPPIASTRRPSTTPAPAVPVDEHRPVHGPNAAHPAVMTPNERREEIVSILARGVLRRLTARLPS